MQELSALSAAPLAVDFGGRTYRLSPLTVRDYGEIERAIRAARPDPCATLQARLADLDETQQRKLLARAYDDSIHDRPVSPDEMAQWMSDTDGIAYVLWLALRREQRDVTLADCRAFVDAEPDRVARALDSASGLPAGNAHCQAGRTGRLTTRRAA